MRFGLSASTIHAVMAPATLRSSVVTGLPLLSYATTILPILSLISLRSVATAKIAITSDETAMAKPDFIMNPSSLPPMPIIISLNA